MIDPWDEIEAAAKTLNVGDWAIRKWRVRGVPHYRRLELLEVNKDLDRDAFDNPPGTKRPRAESEAA